MVLDSVDPVHRSLTPPLLALLAALVLHLLVPASADALEPPAPVVGAERVALVVAANNGGPRRPTLRYAGSDARAMTAVLRELGGVEDTNAVEVFEPSPARLRRAFDQIKDRVRAAKARGNRVEFVFYYSGHSDEDGLLLDTDRVTYPSLRAWIQSVPADVRVAILDSCASGAFTRTKGGKRRPQVLLDSNQAVRGHAYITSSAADENAQESDRIGGSFFTHYLNTGLRGGADADGDRLVTLGEAYQFAFDETLARTEATRGGPQHAAYDFDLVGSGDLVMTDLRRTDGRLVIDGGIGGRVFVRDRNRELRAEFYKPAGSTDLLIAVEPGRYQVTVDDGSRLRRATVDVPEDGQAVLRPRNLATVSRESTVERGHPDASEYVKVPFNIGIVPPASVGGNKRPTITNFSAALLWSRAARLHGLALALAVDIADEEVRGAQATILGSISRGVVVGAQMSTLFNYARDNVRGAQFGVALNLARSLQGAQFSAGVNYARDLQGAQMGIVNTAAPKGTLSGMQFGLVNVGGRVRGLQLGLINYADDADASIGLLSITRRGGVHPEVWTSDTAAVNVGIRFPARHTYSFLTAGIHPAGPGKAYLFGLGLGGKIRLMDKLHLDIDASGHAVFGGLTFSEPMQFLSQARLLFAWDFGRHLSVFGGPSFNLLLDDVDQDTRRPGYGYVAGTVRSGDVTLRMWPGFAAGVRF